MKLAYTADWKHGRSPIPIKGWVQTCTFIQYWHTHGHGEGASVGAWPNPPQINFQSSICVTQNCFKNCTKIETPAEANIFSTLFVTMLSERSEGDTEAKRKNRRSVSLDAKQILTLFILTPPENLPCRPPTLYNWLIWTVEIELTIQLGQILQKHCHCRM